MANNGDTLAIIGTVMNKREKYIGEMLSKPSAEPIDRLVEKWVDYDSKTGENLKQYFKVRIRPTGGWCLTSEGGDYVTARPQAGVEGYIVPRLITHSVEFTLHAIAAWENQAAGKIAETMADTLDSFMEAAQRRRTRLFTGRGDMVLARNSADLSSSGSSVWTSHSDVPVRAVVGDYVTAFKDASGTGDERGLATTDTGTSFLGSTNLYVADVDYEANTLTLSDSGGTATTAKGTQYAVVVPYGVSSSNMTGPRGLEALMDDVNGSFVNDTIDSATYDHVDSIYNLARATYTQLNASVVSSSGYITLAKLQSLVAKCVAKGAAVRDLVFVMHPKQFQYLTQEDFSKVGEYKTLTMAGEDTDVFCVTGLGNGLIPVIVDYGIRNGLVYAIDKSKLIGARLKGGWDKTGSGIFHQKGGSSAGAYAAAKQAFWNMWVEWGLALNYSSGILYGLNR